MKNTRLIDDRSCTIIIYSGNFVSSCLLSNKDILEIVIDFPTDFCERNFNKE